MQFIWNEFLKIIKEEAGGQVVETWFKAVCLQKWEADRKIAHLLVPNQFVSKWLQEHYSDLIKTHLARLLNTNNINIDFTCENKINKESIIPASLITNQTTNNNTQNYNHNLGNKNSALVITKSNQLPIKSKNGKKNSNELNIGYDFNNFIVGPSNSLAHAASWAVCQNIGKVYNPLFIYGGTGLGKTHLLHAIGNEAKKANNLLSVCYTSSDAFTNDFINSIRLDKVQQFRNKYQKVDLLLLDDVQFLSNKEQTQEMFFHIFNTLYDQEKQIILSSDTFPKEIKGLQSRLKSRLEWGLVVDIQVPDLETKIAILKRKAEQNSIEISNEVAQFIASKIISNIRELEGALIRVGAFSTLTNQPVTLELARKVLLNLKEKKNEGLMLDDILKSVSKHYSISISDLKSKKRQKDIATVRQVAFYLMKKLTFCSLQAIGEFVGKRDHSTVLHAVSKIEQIIRKDSSLSQKLSIIEQDLLSS